MKNKIIRSYVQINDIKISITIEISKWFLYRIFIFIYTTAPKLFKTVISGSFHLLICYI